MTLLRRLGDLEAHASRADVRPDTSAGVVPMPVQSPTDLLAVLAEQINLARADAAADPQERARTVAGLAAVAVRVMQEWEARARLEAVERVLKLRREGERQSAERSKAHGKV